MSVVKIGVSLPMSGDRNVHGTPSLIAVAQRAEELGLDAVSVSDVLLGDGTPAVESIVAAAAVATATSRVSVEFGVLVLPIRQVAWLAAQIAGLQHLSNNRIVLGVGAGGFPTSPFWRAVDGPEHDRGAVTEGMLKVLPTLIAGEPTVLAHHRSPTTITLSPPAAVPPILVGGHSDAAIQRAVTLADGWFPSLMPPHTLATRVRTLRARAASQARPDPIVHFGTHVMLGRDGAAKRAELVRELIDSFAMTPKDAESVPVTGSPVQVADQLGAFATAGADSLTLAMDGDDWETQIEILAEARALLHTRSTTPPG